MQIVWGWNLNFHHWQFIFTFILIIKQKHTIKTILVKQNAHEIKLKKQIWIWIQKIKNLNENLLRKGPSF